MMKDETQSGREVEEVLRKHAEALGEHFDTVQIFVTRHEPTMLEGTAGACWGLGNWYARYGQVREWVRREEQGRK